MKKKNVSGFTLIELVIVIILLGIVSIMASKILLEGSKNYVTNKNTIDAQRQGQAALERMTREIRMVRSSSDISVAGSNQFSFTSLDGTAIAYSLSGTNLMQNSQILADGVSSLAFSYYDKNGVVTAVTSAIRNIKISLTVNKNNTIYSVATAVNLRDL
jgi:prepilin-type N-terminal cleavage/methylation domain-containing protein